MNLAIPFVPADDRPKFLGDVAEKIDELVTRDPRRFLELHGAELLPRWQRKRVIARRPSRLEAFAKVMKVMTGREDLISGRVGVPRSDGSCVGPGQQGPEGRRDEYGLVRDTGLSIQRVRRAIGDAVRAGYLLGPRKRADGKMVRGSSGRTYQRVHHWTDEKTGRHGYKGHRVVYVVAPLFYERLGLAPKRLEEGRKASERKRARADRFHPGPLLEGRDRIRRSVSRGAPSSRQGDVLGQGGIGAPSPTFDAQANAERLLGAVALGLRNKHPDWPPDRLRAEAAALIRAGRVTDP